MFRFAILAAVCGLLLGTVSLRADEPNAAPKAAANVEAKAAIRVEAKDKPARGEIKLTVPTVADGLVERVMGQFRLAPADIKPRRHKLAAVPPAAPAAAAGQLEFVQIEVEGVADVADFVVWDGPAIPVPAAPPVQPADMADLNPQEQQYLTQVFQPLLDRELVFVRKSCGLDDVQAKALADAAKPQLKSVVREYFKSLQQPRRIVHVNGIQRVEPAQAVPNKLVEKCVAETVAKVKLPADKAAAYADEVARRTAFNKEAGVRAFVAAIDDRVMLDDSQREKLTVALTKNWDESWAPYVQTLLYATNFNPPVPNEILLPILRQNQKDVWQTPNQGGQVFFGGGVIWGGGVQGNFIIDR